MKKFIHLSFKRKFANSKFIKIATNICYRCKNKPEPHLDKINKKIIYFCPTCNSNVDPIDDGLEDEDEWLNAMNKERLDYLKHSPETYGDNEEEENNDFLKDY